MIPRYMVEPAYLCIRLMDYLNYIPVKLNVKSRKICYKNRRGTRIVHFLVFLLSVCKDLHVASALVQLLIYYKPDSLPIVILTMLWLSLCVTSTLWNYDLFHKGLYETVILFNSLEFEEACDDATIPEAGAADRRSFLAKVKTNLAHLRSLNLQEAMCVLTPFAAKLFAPLYLLVMAICPHWPIFLTSLVMPRPGVGIENWTWFATMILLVIIETVEAFFTESNILFLFFFELALQVTHLARFSNAADELRSATTKDDVIVTARLMDEHLAKFNFYYTLVTICNVDLSRIAFTGKLMALSCAIFGTYYVLSSYEDSRLVFVIFFGTLSLEAVAFYTISCHMLHRVGDVSDKYKKYTLMLLHKRENNWMTPEEIKVRSYRIKVMPRMGIKDGGFRILESEATLLFIDFYLNQVISLLLM